MRDLARDKVVELIQNKYGVLMHKIAYEILKDWHYVEDVEQEVLWKLILHCEDKTMLPPEMCIRDRLYEDCVIGTRSTVRRC